MLGICGYLCLDLLPTLGEGQFVFVPGQLRECGAMRASVGGVVGNTGGAVARLRVPAKIRGAVGEDAFGVTIREMMSPLMQNGKLDLFVMKGGATATTVVLNPPGQDRMFLVSTGVNDLIDSSTFDADYRKGLRLLHFGYPPICPAMTRNNGAELRKLYAACAAEGVLTSLDMSLPSPGSFSYTMDWVAYLKNLLPLTNLFCPSIDELRFMLRASESATPDDLLDQLFALGAQAVFLKMGADGAKIRTADTSDMETRFPAGWRNVNHFLPAAKVKVYGTTGAGDSAIAGLLAGLDMGYSAVKAAELGTKTAERVISNPAGTAGLQPLFS